MPVTLLQRDGLASGHIRPFTLLQIGVHNKHPHNKDWAMDMAENTKEQQKANHWCQENVQTIKGQD